MVAKALRGQGLRVEMYPIDKDIEDIKNYASAKEIKGIIVIKNSGEIEILDLKNDTAEKTDIKSLTGGVS